MSVPPLAAMLKRFTRDACRDETFGQRDLCGRWCPHRVVGEHEHDRARPQTEFLLLT